VNPDRIRREFQRLSEVRVSEGVLERARERPPTPPTPPGQRVFVAVAALAVFAIAGFFARSAFRPGTSSPEPPAGESGVPTVLGFDCGGQGPGLLTTEVQVQSEGVLVHVEGLGDATGVEGSRVDDDPGTGTWAVEFGEENRPQIFDVALAIQPGKYVVRCAHGDFLAGKLTPAEGEAVRIVDPDGIWHDPALACTGPEQSPRDFFDGGEPSVNPVSIIDQVIRHAVPGIVDSDVIEYAAYPGSPRGEEWHFLVLRGGEVLARLRSFEAGDRRTIEVEACASSEIGHRNAPSAGPIGTTREVPGFLRCDPYANSCVSVWVSEARYAQLRDEAVPQPDAEYPSCEEVGPDEACSTYPDDQPVELLLMPPDRDAFVAQDGCGATADEMCRLNS
jgi:hypothetical protein